MKDKVINDLLSRIAQLEYEVEELQKENDLDCNLNKSLLKDIDKAGKEIERLHSIIKEVREYIEKSKAKLPLGRNDFTCAMVYSDEVVLVNELLEILDKEKENE